MRVIEEAISQNCKVLPGDVLKIDHFLNHQIDVSLISKGCEEFLEVFGDKEVNKILTVESSGIGIACLAAMHFGCPVLYAKKLFGKNSDDKLYSASCYSYTKGIEYNISVSAKYLTPDDRVLIIDDFLAGGNALKALIRLCEQAGAHVVGCGTVVEKAYQGGGDAVRAMGYQVHSLARIASMSPEDGIKFC
ncbi:MAG: xanthine phosphoribosyltransferase [Clostridia bacterium]|nr:xanthine phosphoribosyltransferase [Clostridia bacterium]MBQ1934502.1 xanthine phosphoribosyltransferase [Clostridia bacterium]MBQ5648939.1 xanthine phosphoribosyltransferase [Clostridia bacterium]MBQ5809865.1 xanthine phosphoribosyltransferase [Clostridia bacterium]